MRRRKVKVTFLTWEYPPDIYGGAGVHVKYLTQHLKRHINIEVRTRGKDDSQVEEDGIRVRRYKPWSFQEASTPGIRGLLEAFSTCLAFVRDEIDAKIVHSHTWYTNLAGFYAKQLYDARLVATVHSLEPKRPWKREAMGNAYRLSTWAEETCLHACDRIIAVSTEDKKDIVECYGVEEKRIAVIPNGIDIEKYKRRENPSLLKGYGVKKPYVLFLGRLSRQKGVFDALKVSSKLPKGVDLVMVTGRPDEEGIEQELARRVKGRKNVVWVNKMLTEEEAIAFYSSAEVFVSPSIYEPFGIINLEAMACSRPVVSTRVGGIKDVVVEGATGFLVEAGDSAGIAEKVSMLLSNKELTEVMGNRGRERVEAEFSWSRIAERTLALYEKLVANGGDDSQS